MSFRLDAQLKADRTEQVAPAKAQHALVFLFHPDFNRRLWNFARSAGPFSGLNPEKALAG